MSQLRAVRLSVTTTIVGLMFGCGGAVESNQDSRSGVAGATPIEDPFAPQSSGGASAEAIANCEATTLAGQVEGHALDRHYPYDMGARSSSTGGGTSQSLSTPLGATGQATMSWGGDLGSGTSLDNSATRQVFDATMASLTLPLGLGFDDRYLCVTGQSTVELESNYYLRTYRGIGLLPDCASGTPVEGSLSLCLGDDCPEILSGIVDNVSYDFPSIGMAWTNSYVATTLSEIDLRIGILPASNGQASLAFSWLRDPLTGNVYCGGASSSATVTSNPADSAMPADTKTVQVKLRDLRRVGNCADIDGSDTLEVRSCIDT